MPLATIPDAAHAVDRDADVIVYCHHGARSEAAASELLAAGFRRVRNLTEESTAGVATSIHAYDATDGRAPQSRDARAAVVVAVGAAFAWWRARYLRAVTAMTTERPFDSEGVVRRRRGVCPGADRRSGHFASCTAPAILRRRFATSRSRCTSGISRRGAAAAGHGRTIREFSHVTADALSDAAPSGVPGASREPRLGRGGRIVDGRRARGAARGEQPDLPALDCSRRILPCLDESSGSRSCRGSGEPSCRPCAPATESPVLDPVERERSLAYGVFPPRHFARFAPRLRRAVADCRASPRRRSSCNRAPTIASASPTPERAFARLGASRKSISNGHGCRAHHHVDYGRDKVAALLVGVDERRAPQRSGRH